jgi:hypothetical protein
MAEAIPEVPCVNDKKDKNTNILFDETNVLIRQARKCCMGTVVLADTYKPMD